MPGFFIAYLMTSTITVPIYGKLLDVYGRKPFYIFGLSVFIIGSALSGQSHSMMVSFIVAALIAGQLMTRGGRYKLISMIAAALMSIGLYMFTQLGADSNYTSVIIDMLVLGLGIGALLPILNVAVQNAFPYHDMGIVNAAQQFVRSLGAVIATPILGTVLTNKFADQMKLNMPAALQ